MRWLAAPLTLLVAVLCVVLVHVSRADPDDTLGGGTSIAVTLEVAGALGAWIAGGYTWLRWRSRWAGGLLAGAGVSLLLTVVTIPAVGPSALFTAGLVGRGLVPVLAGAATLAYLGVRRAPVAVAIGAVVVLHGVIPALGFDPRGSGCFACPRNLVAVANAPTVYDSAQHWGQIALAAAGSVLAAVALVLWWLSARTVRGVTGLVVVPGVVVAALGSVIAWSSLGSPDEGFDARVRTLWLVECAGVLVIGLGIATRVVLARRLRDRVADLVVDVLPEPDRLRDELARTLGDPSLSVSFPRDGSALPADEGRGRLLVLRDSRVVALISHDAALHAVPDRVTSTVQAAGLALEHAGGQARLRVELDELAELRARIVTVSDAERRRLERNLHDGAQQRLIALVFALRSEARRGGAPDELAIATDEVRTALAELRAIAHGIHPVVLTDAGLAAALRELAEDADVPVRIGSAPERRSNDAAEAAAYRVVADVVRCAGVADPGTLVDVRVSLDDEALRADLTVDGADPGLYAQALRTAAERVEAANGRLQVDDGLHVWMRIPCGS